MAKTLVIKCTCEQAYQDEQYGLANRLHNWDEQEGQWRCSVCGNLRVLKAVESSEKKAPKK